jgi:pyridoxamine 5'-phosphate oxidase family protein
MKLGIAERIEAADSFSEADIAFLKNEKLARIAIISECNQLDLASVSFDFDGTYFYIDRHEVEYCREFSQVTANHKYKVVLSWDRSSMCSSKLMAVRVYGEARIMRRKGKFENRSCLRISPKIFWSWGIDESELSNKSHMVKRVFQ